MSAIDTVLKLVKAGEHVILGDNTYGGTFRLFSKILVNYGVQLDLADTTDISKLENAFKPNTKMVFVETPTNPVMSVTDLKAVSDLAPANGAKVACDNTFMSPYFQRPIEFGCDIAARIGDDRHVQWHAWPNGPTEAGSYHVQADIVDPNYERYSSAEDSGTLVVAQNTAKFEITDLVQNYDGHRKRVQVSATPDIPFDVTYNGAASEPVAPGSYEVKVTPRNQAAYGSGSSSTLIVRARVAATVNGQPNNTKLRFTNGRGGQLTNFPAFVEPNQNEWKLQFVDTDDLSFTRWSDGSRENPRRLTFGRSTDPASYVFNAEAAQKIYLEAQTVVAPNLPPRSGGGAIGSGWYAVGEMARFDAAKWGEGAINFASSEKSITQTRML